MCIKDVEHEAVQIKSGMGMALGGVGSEEVNVGRVETVEYGTNIG